jgi:hypothetical protein
MIEKDAVITLESADCHSSFSRTSEILDIVES